MKTHVFAGALMLTAVVASAAGPETKSKAPRTAEGQPDLQGVRTEGVMQGRNDCER